MKRFWLFLIIAVPFMATANRLLEDNGSLDSITEENVEDSVVVTDLIVPIYNEEDTVSSNIWYEYPQYEDWEVATLKGKLKMDGIPLSPSAKIFMKKDSLVNISFSAPFVGEAARIELVKDTVTIVNKIKKTYVKLGYQEWMDSQGYGILGIGELQNLFLDRFFLPGQEIELDTMDNLVEVYYDEVNSFFNIEPLGEAKLPGVDYGFVVDNYFTPYMLIVLPKDDPEKQFYAVYDHTLNGYNLILRYQNGNEVRQIQLDLQNPEWKGEEPKSVDLKKYRHVTLREVMSF